LKVIVPVDPSTLSISDKHGALQYLMFLKQKRCGKIKGRGCADGRKQRLYLSKEDTSSPTVAIESVNLSCVIDADENRDVATVDIPGAFLHADMDDTVYLKIDGDMALMLTNLAPCLCKPYLVTTKNKSPALYVLLKKALYGTLQAALLFWEKLSGLLISWGFAISPYDRCVANKHINGSICTILWHVDDLKISHIDPAVVTEIIQQLSDQFGAVAPLTIHCGKQHDYLGMQLDFSIPSKIRITMIDYINKIFADCPSDMNGTAPTPAGNHLFMVNTTNPLLLPPADADLFHHIVAQLLFLCKRARPDIQTAVSFLCTCVQHPDSDDYKKLTCVIKYLRNTISLPLTLEASDMKLMQWWVDASYEVHHDMKSHTGGLLSLGKGDIYATSTRQKLNTKSSTEAELVGINDVIPQALWTNIFYRNKAMTVGNLSFIKITRVLFYLKIMVVHLAASAHATLTFVITLLLTRLNQMKSVLNTVLLNL
jgi:Reverse transcriptase (RNA-dependent DNA polymerase)